MPGISYDESGSLAGYFGVTFLAVVLVPATYIVFKPAKKGQCSSCQKLADAALERAPCGVS